jgi:hypothetical protein
MRDRGYDMARATLATVAFCSTLCHSTQSLAATNPLGPAAIDAGPVAITPIVGVEIKHRDNIYLQQNNPTDSWIYIARPAVSAVAQDRDNLYELSYAGEAGWYEVSRHNDDNDYFDNTFSGDAHMELSDRWIVEGYASWAALHEDRGTGLSEGLIGEVLPEPIKYDQADVGGSLQFGSDESVGQLLFRVGYMDREYQNFKNLTRQRDRDEATAAATFFYPLAPNTKVLAEYIYKDIHYPNPLALGPPLDSNENSLLTGVRWEITPNLTSTAKIGYVEKRFDDSQRKDWDGLGWSLELLMQPREQDTISVQSSRAPEETSLQGDFIKRSSVTTTWTHNWSDRVYTELGAYYGQDIYEQSFDDRKDDTYNASFRVGYLFRRWANVYMGYSYADRNSNAGDLSYTDNIFNIGVELSL